MNPNNTEVNKLTKESIALAAKALLMERKDLSVTDICKKAGVSRNAFYRNFGMLDEVIVFYIALGWTDYSEKNGVEACPEDKKGIHLLRFFYEEREFVRALREKKLLHLVERTFVNTIVPEGIDGGARYFLYSAAYLMYGFIRAMIDNDFRDKPEDVQQMIESFNLQNNG